MEEIDARLVEAEHVKAAWTPVQDLIIDSLSEQMDELKVTTLALGQGQVTTGFLSFFSCFANVPLFLTSMPFSQAVVSVSRCRYTCFFVVFKFLSLSPD